jgi:serine/threonine-protein kinase
MLAGRLPFEATDPSALTAQHASHLPPLLRQVNPSVPPVVAQIVHQMLSKEPAARYRTAQQVALVLRQQGLGTWEIPPASTWADRSTPVPSRADVWEEAYPEESLETEGIDWLMLGLGLAALALVLGLIPLWRQVYLRWAGVPIGWQGWGVW